MLWFRFPLAVSNSLCHCLGWQPLVLQPEPLRLGEWAWGTTVLTHSRMKKTLQIILGRSPQI